MLPLALSLPYLNVKAIDSKLFFHTEINTSLCQFFFFHFFSTVLKIIIDVRLINDSCFHFIFQGKSLHPCFHIGTFIIIIKIFSTSIFTDKDRKRVSTSSGTWIRGIFDFSYFSQIPKAASPFPTRKCEFYVFLELWTHNCPVALVYISKMIHSLT